MRLKSSSGHKSSDIFSKSEQMSLKMICFKILYRHILKVSMPSECQTSYNSTWCLPDPAFFQSSCTRTSTGGFCTWQLPFNGLFQLHRWHIRNVFVWKNCGSILSLTFIIPLFPPEVNDFQPIFSRITGTHKFVLRSCLVGKIGKHFFFKLPLSIKNSSENVPYFWNCFVFTLLKNCAMLFAGGENRCLWMVRS